MPVVFVKKIKECFLDSLYYFLDGMVHLALSGEEPLFGEQAPHRNSVDWRDKVSRFFYIEADAELTLIVCGCSRILALSLP